MKNRDFKYSGIVLLLIVLIFCGCKGKKEKSDLYVMEELESASSIKAPRERIERLNIFLNNHPGHMSRKFAYNKTFETLITDIGKPEEAMEFFDEAMAEEEDPAIRGSFFYRKFAYLWDIDEKRAIEFASNLLKSNEKSFRLFLYIGFDLKSREKYKIAEKMFRKALDVADNPPESSFAKMVYGEFLATRGRNEEAVKILESSENPFAGKQLGKILWERGERERAIEVYIDLAAGVPRQRAEVKLDSLYAVIYPDSAGGPDGNIIERRTAGKRSLPESRFVDTEGKYYNLPDYRGKKLVIGAWSPT
ncbi:MAG TPA: tetratricopeptide repeat protein [Candidatus Krumholzibacteriaceae bacterium]|nr:tetratricopeptide repeat protein [Candidatus Krumholzibacteriaceae bacterium]